MSFKRITGSVANLSAKDKIMADELLDMLVCVFQDVFEHNGVTSVDELTVGDDSALVKREYNLIKMLITIFEKNKTGLFELRSVLQEKINASVNEINAMLPQIEDVKFDIERAEDKKKELDIQCERLSVQRGHLLNVEEECSVIQRQIERLSDPFLDELVVRKSDLEADLKRREEKENQIGEEMNTLQSEMREKENQISLLEERIQHLKERQKQLSEEEEACREEKEGLEAGNAKMEVKITEYEDWISRCPEMNQSIRDKYNELQAKVTVLMNAVNSSFADEFLMETLYRIPNTSEKLSVDNYPDYNVADYRCNSVDDLRIWFDSMNQRIEGLLVVYERIMGSMVTQAQKITKNENE